MVDNKHEKNGEMICMPPFMANWWERDKSSSVYSMHSQSHNDFYKIIRNFDFFLLSNHLKTLIFILLAIC